MSVIQHCFLKIIFFLSYNEILCLQFLCLFNKNMGFFREILKYFKIVFSLVKNEKRERVNYAYDKMKKELKSLFF